MNIKPKLFLNNSPQTQDENSLVFARNMKLDDDGSLISDNGYNKIDTGDPVLNRNIVGKIIGLNNTYFIFTDHDEIFKYTESNNDTDGTFTKIHANWKYYGGKIDGSVNTNISGEEILTIAESDGSIRVPLWHINLDHCNDNDNSTTYTQTPNIPIINLTLHSTYAKTIPNGTYVFYIRYLIREGVYTHWMCCSTPIFAGVSEHDATIQGGVKHVNIHKDSAKSFVLHLSIADNDYSNTDNNYKYLYSKFQLGFVISHDDSVNARVWKTFNMSDFEIIPVDAPDTRNLNNIYFDYDDVTEIDIDELTTRPYSITNVRNITSYKNKLYISNYHEEKIREDDLRTLADCIDINIGEIKSDINNLSSKLYYTPYPGAGQYECEYNSDKQCYDKVNALHGRRDILRDVWDYEIDNAVVDMDTPIKGDSRKMENAAKLYMTWAGDVQDPDIAIVDKSINFVKEVSDFRGGSCPFVGTWDRTYQTAISEACTYITGDGGSADSLRYYEPKPGYEMYHPLCRRELAFVFGTVPPECPSNSPYTKSGIYPNYPKDDLYLKNNHKTFITNDRGFYGERRKAVQDAFKTSIGSMQKVAIAYTFINNGTTVYYGNRHLNNDGEILEDKYNYIALNRSRHPDAGVCDIKPSILIDPNGDTTTSRGIVHEVFSNLLGINTRETYNGTYETYNGQIQCYGINDLGQFVLKCDNGTESAIVQTNKIYVRLNVYTFKVENIEEGVEDMGEHGWKDRYDISMTTTSYDVPVTFDLKKGVLTIKNNNNTEDKQIPSLMPCSTYRFALNLIDNNGVISDCYKIGDDVSIGPLHIYPADTSTNTPEQITSYYYLNAVIRQNKKTIFEHFNDRYSAYFISVANVGDKIVQCFDFNRVNGVNYLSALELDAMLYHGNENITILGEDGSVITNAAKYASSGNSSNKQTFGNVGVVYWDSTSDPSVDNKVFYIKINNNNNSEVIQYNRCTPYLPLDADIDYANIRQYEFYNSYRCIVRKPNFKLALNTYVSGTDIYSIERTESIALNEFGSYIFTQLGNKNFIISNFNLNYLSLTTDINDQIFRINNGKYKQVCKVINSLTLSSIYELKSMYKSFYNEIYTEKIGKHITRFNNTIRVSNVLSDETINNSVFTFKATDYYNIPTNRGIIVKLFTIGNNIFVHTKSGFYKFDGNQTITSTDKDITLTESEPFTTGITSVFDSEYGYGGISNKEAGCATYDSYFFYDALSNHIFAFNGSGGVQPIDSSINKFINLQVWDKCYTLHDEANKRIFFNFVNTSNNLTISYNYKSKNFISLHDINLEKTFSAHHNCYSFDGDSLYKLFKSNGDISTIEIDHTYKINNIYGVATALCNAIYPINSSNNQDTCFGIAVLVYPTNNMIETMDSVTIDADIIQNIAKVNNCYDLSAKQHNRENPINSIQIITDNCKSNTVRNTDVTDPTSPNGYKGFKYDRGSWNVNYFRNTLDTTNIYHYPDSPRAAYPPTSDNYSLIYGKYFIININFINDKVIKIENIFVKTNNI